MRFARLAALLLATACADDVKADFDAICNAAERSGASGEADSTAKAVKIARWLGPQLKTEKAKKFMAALATMDPSKKAQALTDEAARHGVTPCPIAAETWPAPR